MKRKAILYNPALKELAKQNRNNSTKSEIRLWLKLKDSKLLGFDFHRQKPIGDFICDFFCHELMLAIEVDGLTHDWEEVQQKDKVKELTLKKLGITVIRFSDGDVLNDTENVLRQIRMWIEDKAKHTP